MKTHLGLFIAAALFAALANCGINPSSEASVYSISAQAALNQLKKRPLKLPRLSTGEPCPISHGSKAKVPQASYIFCSGCYWFGKGPVFLALAWSDQSTDEGRFSLTRVPYEMHAYRAKTPWVASPDYSGPILIRGQALARNERLRFRSAEITDEFVLQAPARDREESTRWSFWPTSMFVPRAGCYGIQIDTTDATDSVIFEATPPQ